MSIFSSIIKIVTGPIGDVIGVVGTVLGVAGGFSAAEDAEDAYHAQASDVFLNAQHRKEVAEYNAAIYIDNALRLRNEMVGRLNEVAGVNIGRFEADKLTNITRLQGARETNVVRLQEERERGITRAQLDRETDVDRLNTVRNRTITRTEDVLGIGTGRFQLIADRDKGRLSEDFARLAAELNMDAERDIDRITEISEESVVRFGRRAKNVATTGFEIESDLRTEIARDISSQRAYYATGNIVVNSGTPMRLQTDAYQQGEIQAQRIRRDYRIKVQDLKDTASDTLREALFEVEDIRTDTSRRFDQAFRETSRITEDINTTLTFNLSDLYRNAGIEIEDINFDTDIRLIDINRTAGRTIEDIDIIAGLQISDINLEIDTRVGDIITETTRRTGDISLNLGYDLSDTEFNAKKMDQEAALTLIQGDAELAAGVNRAAALEQAGSGALAAGTLTALGGGLTDVASTWYTADSLANQVPVTTSTPDFVR